MKKMLMGMMLLCLLALLCACGMGAQDAASADYAPVTPVSEVPAEFAYC